MFLQQGVVQVLDEAVALWWAYSSGAVLDPFELQEQFEGMAFRSSAVLTSAVGLAQDRRAGVPAS